MFRKAKIIPMHDEPVAAETPAEIVAKIRRGAALQLAEKNLAELRRRVGEIQSEMGALVAAKQKVVIAEHNAAIDRDLQRLASEHAALGTEVAPAFSAVQSARAEFDARVVEALSPLRRQAVTSALKAVAELRAALEIFDNCNSAARRVGAPEQRRPTGILGYLDNLASAFAR
jgi:hypothetical protein